MSHGLTRYCQVMCLSLALVLTGCASQEGGLGPKTGIGAAMGAAGGGLLAAAAGGKSKGIIAGVLIGGLLGGAIGNSLDQKDRKLAQEAASQALETQASGTTSNWYNPDSGNSGAFTPTRTYQNPEGAYCREYQQTVTVGNEKQQAYGTACRQADGTWKIVS